MPTVPVYSDSNSPSKIRGGQGALNNQKAQKASQTTLNNQKAIESSQTELINQEKTVKTAQVFNTPAMKAHRRELRNNSTPAEKALWNLLKGKQIKGLQFRRQFSVGQHILDFYCPSLKLAIELDGDYHYHMLMPERDGQRDQELLVKNGIKTLRFENKMVFEHPMSIVDAVLQELDKAHHTVGVNAPLPPLILEGETSCLSSHIPTTSRRENEQ